MVQVTLWVNRCLAGQKDMIRYMNLPSEIQAWVLHKVLPQDINTAVWHMSKENAQLLGTDVRDVGKKTTSRKSVRTSPKECTRRNPGRSIELREQYMIHDMQQDSDASDWAIDVVRSKISTSIALGQYYSQNWDIKLVKI